MSPRYRRLCKEGEEPTTFLENKYFIEELNIKSGFGPPELDEAGEIKKRENGRPILKWNACWSAIPIEWQGAVEELVDYIKNKYIIETIDTNFYEDDNIQVKIDQVKDKFGSLRFYYTSSSKEIDGDINAAIARCEKRLAKDDPLYGQPY